MNSSVIARLLWTGSRRWAGPTRRAEKPGPQLVGKPPGMRDGAPLEEPQARLRRCHAHRAPGEELKVVRDVPVQPPPPEALREQSPRIRRRKHRRAAGLEDESDALEQSQRRGGMLDDLVQRDIVEKARLVVLRIEDADAGLQAVAP